MAVAFAPEAFAIEAFDSEIPVNTWYDLGQLSDVAACSTAQARQIASLTLFNGRIYVSYGDYGGNQPSGVHVISFDDTNWFDDLGTFGTFADFHPRTVGSELWFPANQATGSQDIAVVSSSHVLSTISDSNVTHFHLFDAIQYGTDQFVCGGHYVDASTSYARVWRRSSGTWSAVETISSAVTTVGFRYYGLFELGGDLYAVPFHANMRKTSNGTSWSSVSSTTFGYRPARFMNVSGGVIWRESATDNSWGHTRQIGGTLPLVRWTGTGSTSTVESNSIDHCLDEGGVPWVLRDVSGTLEIAYGNASATSWTQESDEGDGVPANASALCVTDDAFFIGTEDSHLWLYYR